MNLNDSLQQWAALRSVGKKSSTQLYYQDTIKTILRYWPGAPPDDVDVVSEQDLIPFVLAVATLSATRFNMMLSALKATVPGALKLKRRRVVLRERPLLSQLDFARLLAELDRRPRSHGGLVVRFLAHTGLRINEARQMKWGDVRADSFLAPGAITKNGRARSIPFVNGIRETLDRLRLVAGAGAPAGAAVGGLILPQAEIKTALLHACVASALPRLSHHDFRHLYATRCIQSGVDMPTVARWLGHQDGGALLSRTYFHLVDEHSRRMAAKVVI